MLRRWAGGQAVGLSIISTGCAALFALADGAPQVTRVGRAVMAQFQLGRTPVREAYSLDDRSNPVKMAFLEFKGGDRDMADEMLDTPVARVTLLLHHIEASLFVGLTIQCPYSIMHTRRYYNRKIFCIAISKS